MLHLLETNVDCKVFSAGFAVELLNVTVLVASDSVLNYLGGLAENTSVKFGERLDNSGLDFHSQFPTELHSPDVFALYTSVDMVWT